MKRKFISSLLMIIMTVGILANFSVGATEYGEEYINQPTTKTYSQKFSDVSQSHWAYKYIMEMESRGVLNGYPDGRFYPENTVTRGEFAKIMCLAAGLTVQPVSETSFEDVYPSDWFAPYVECGKLYLNGYDWGVESGKLMFLPTTVALREDIAVALVKLKGYDVSVYDNSLLTTMFTDVESISADARKYVAVAIENGLISGYQDRTFRGQATITRAEAATLLWRAYQYGNQNKVFEQPVATPNPTPVPTIAPTPEPEIIVVEEIRIGDEDYEVEEPEETGEPEPEYLYELKTIASNINDVAAMIATDDGIMYLDMEENKIMEVKKDSNKATCVIEGSDIPYLGDKELTKSEKANFNSDIIAIGINENDGMLYCIIDQGREQYVYNVETGDAIILDDCDPVYNRMSDLDNNYKWDSHTICFNENNDLFIEVIQLRLVDDQYKYVKTYQNNSGNPVRVDNDTFIDYEPGSGFGMSKINDRTDELEPLDIYVGEDVALWYLGANNTTFYAMSRDYDKLYTFDTNGDGELLCSVDDIDNIDGKTINLSAMFHKTFAVDDDGVIYYWDGNYNCIRQLEHV